MRTPFSLNMGCKEMGCKVRSRTFFMLHSPDEGEGVVFLQSRVNVHSALLQSYPTPGAPVPQNPLPVWSRHTGLRDGIACSTTPCSRCMW